MVVRPTNWISVLTVMFVFSGLFVLQGCNDDTVCPLPDTGTVTLTLEPISLDVPWSLTVPGGLIATGVTDTVLHEMPIGEYVVTWGQVGGWVRSDTNPATLNLQTDETIEFLVVYEPDNSPSGIITIEFSPVCIDPPWVLTGPNGFITDGTQGVLILTGLEEGNYSMAWGDIPGWETPDPSVVDQFLPDEGILTFAGTYVEMESGLITIDPNPDSLNASWELAGPDGFSFAGIGELTLGNMAVGDYSITWNEVDQWVAPEMETLAVVSGETTAFTGVYEVDLPLATTMDILLENFQYVYEERFFAGYESILHADHRTIVLQSTFDDWQGGSNPLTSLYFDRDSVESIHHNIFNGVLGADPHGNNVDPISAIEIPVLERLGAWEQVYPSMEYFGAFNAYEAMFTMGVYFYIGDSYRFEVDQRFRFIAAEDSGVWKLLGVIPLEPNFGIATESVLYDEVLSLFR